MGMNFKHHGTVDCRQNVEIPGFEILVNPKLIWSSWNLACYYGAASTWCGKIIVPFGAGLGISFSQTLASHNKRDGFGRECATFGDERKSVASYYFQKIPSVNIEQQECCVLFGNFSGFVWTFLYINQAFYAHNSSLNYMQILQCIKTGWEIKYVSLVACLRPMKEMGINFEHPATVTRPQTLRYLVFIF